MFGLILKQQIKLNVDVEHEDDEYVDEHENGDEIILILSSEG